MPEFGFTFRRNLYNNVLKLSIIIWQVVADLHDNFNELWQFLSKIMQRQMFCKCLKEIFPCFDQTGCVAKESMIYHK